MKHPDQDIGKLARAVDTGIDVDELLKSILFQWAKPEEKQSGTDGLANALHDCYEAAPSGGQVQARILHDVMVLIAARTSVGGAADEDLEELEREFEATMGSLREADG